MNLINKYCSFSTLAVLLSSVLAAPLVLSLFSASGCTKKESMKLSNTQNKLRLVELQSKITLAKTEQAKIKTIFDKRQAVSQKLRDQLTSAFGKLPDSEREEVKNAIKEGNVEEQFPNREDVAGIKTTFDEWCAIESSLKKNKTTSDKYDEEIKKGEALEKKIQRIIEDDSYFEFDTETSDPNEPSTTETELLDSLKALSEESALSDDEVKSEDVNNAQEMKNLLDKIVEEVNSRSEKSKKPEDEVDFVKANKRSAAGYEAFKKYDFLLAKQEAETALTFDPNCEGAKKLLADTQAKLDELERSVCEGYGLLDSGKYEDALKKVREVKALCTKYPDADTLETKVIASLVAYLIDNGKRALEGNDRMSAYENVRKALMYNPNSSEAKTLETKVIESLVVSLVDDGKKALERNDGTSAHENARKALQYNPNSSEAKELEDKSVSLMTNALVTEGWKLYGLNDKQCALSKAIEALKLNPNDEMAEELYDECCPLNKSTKPGSRAVLTINGVEFAFRYCPAGIFTMGSAPNEEGRYKGEAQRKVSIGDGFWICETETTQAQWDAVGGKKAKECRFKGAKLPVERVSLSTSEAFVNKLNELNIVPSGWHFVLPTEEQWEYACRAGTTGSTYGVSLDEAAWYYGNSRGETHEVGKKVPNNWGIYDMLGNVREWTTSQYYLGKFVIRGGYWCDDARDCRPACLGFCSPSDINDGLGLRILLVRR